MPTIFSLYGLYYLYTTPKSFDHHSFIHSEPTLSSTHSSSLYHSSHDLSTNSSKLAYLSAWQSTHNTTLKLMNFNPGGYPICIDTGASSCISNNKSDFVNLHPTTNTVLNGVGSGLNIDGVGTLCWKFTNDNEDEISLHIQDSLYVPSAPMHLLSPQTIAQQTDNSLDGFHANGPHGIFTFAGFSKSIHYISKNNLPIFFTSSDFLSMNVSESSTHPHHSYLSTENVTLDDNLSSSQRKLLLKHHQIGHLHMTKIQQLAKDGIFGDHMKILAHCEIPLCKACLHGKQHKRPLTASTFQPLDSSHLQP